MRIAHCFIDLDDMPLGIAVTFGRRRSFYSPDPRLVGIDGMLFSDCATLIAAILALLDVEADRLTLRRRS